MSKRNKDCITAIIIDDDDDDEVNNNQITTNNVITQNNYNNNNNSEQINTTQVIKKKRTLQPPLKNEFTSDITIIEVGIDEAGRGPMFGRVYAGIVILPKNNTFDHSMMKDSKKFHSKKKIEQVADYIKENSLAWAVEYEDENTIDEINILQATQSAMHKGIKKIISKIACNSDFNLNNIILLVDGNYFKPYTTLNKNKTKLETLKYYMIEGGDNKYTSIAAASILAKVERDKYIEELCKENTELIEYYGIDTNKGYGSKKHMEGIKKYGITKWHRKTFGICKEFC